MKYNILDAIKDEVTGKADHVPEPVYRKRLAICRSCPNLKHLIPLTGGNCKICGCFVRAKAKYRSSQCPDDPPRWFAELFD